MTSTPAPARADRRCEARVEQADEGTAAEETAKDDLARAEAFLKAAEGE